MMHWLLFSRWSPLVMGAAPVIAMAIFWKNLTHDDPKAIMAVSGILVVMHFLTRPVVSLRLWWGALHGALGLFSFVAFTLFVAVGPNDDSNAPLIAAVGIATLLTLASGFIGAVVRSATFFRASRAAEAERPIQTAHGKEPVRASVPLLPTVTSSPPGPELRPVTNLSPQLPAPMALLLAPESASRHVLISYRRSDSNDITGRIYDRLTHAFGREAVFKDVDSIPFGVDFRHHLQGAVTQCQAVLVVIGKSWVEAQDEKGRRRLDDARDFVRIEVETALQKGVPVIPVLVKGAAIPDEEELPPALKDLAFRNGLPIRDDPDFHRDMDRLIRDLEKHFGGKAWQR